MFYLLIINFDFLIINYYLGGGSIPLSSIQAFGLYSATPSWVCPGNRSLFNYHRLAGHTREPH
jgi:hypothetical protein